MSSKALESVRTRLEQRFGDIQGVRVEPCTVTNTDPLTVSMGPATGILGVSMGLVYEVGTANNAIAVSTGKSKPLIFPIGIGSGGGGGSFARATATFTTIPLMDEGRAQGLVPLGRAYQLLKIETSAPARVRLYATTGQRATDGTRPDTDRPLQGFNHGVMLDFNTSLAMLSSLLAPPVHGFTDGSPLSSLVPFDVTNISGAIAPITVTLTYLKLEGS
jgi:hypothetical protein